MVPAIFTKGGLHVDIQIVGPRGGNALSLSAAQAIEERTGGFRKPPLLQNLQKTWSSNNLFYCVMI